MYLKEINKKKAGVFATCVLLVALIAGCAPTGNEATSNDPVAPKDEAAVESQENLTPEQLAIIQGEEGIDPEDINDDAYPGKEYVDRLYDKWNQIARDYAPEIRTLPNGQMVQRTPTEYEIDPNAWMQATETNSYNTYWLDADNRGCESCHADLDALVKNMPYEHPVFWNEAVGNETTLQQCLFCHSYAPGYIAKDYEFGTLMHGIHYGTRNSSSFEASYEGNCMSCHNATENGMGMEMWDLTKYDRLWGINDVEDVKGDFSFEQETTHSLREVFSYDWMHTYYDNMRHGAGVNGLDMQLPQSLFDEWEITVEGNVVNEYTAKLPDLIKEAEADGAVVTKTSKMVCNWSPVGGGGVTNAEITGIPVSWLVEKAGGYKEDSTGVRALRADGSSKRAFPLDKLENEEAFLVYQIGGEYLDASRGYPCTNWVEGVDAQVNSKQLSAYKVDNEEIDFDDPWDGNPNAWHNEAGEPMNKPSAAIFNVPEGLLVQNGQPYTFEGYADGFNEKIVSLEFSMDRGETWAQYDVANSDVNKVVWWNFVYTPEKEGAYCLTIRATTETGRVSYETQTVMFNAKDKMPSAEETTVIESGGLIPPKTTQTNENN